MSEYVWTWDGYSVRKRRLAFVEKDRREHRGPTPFRSKVFDSEIEAVEYAFQDHSAQRDKAEFAVQSAQRLVRKWWLRRDKLRKAQSQEQKG